MNEASERVHAALVRSQGDDSVHAGSGDGWDSKDVAGRGRIDEGVTDGMTSLVPGGHWNQAREAYLTRTRQA